MKQPIVLRSAYHLMLLVLSMALALQLAGCGGGTSVADGGIVGTGITDLAQQGEITAVGPHSIVVNGQTVSTLGATIMVNGQPAQDTALMVGMVVTIITSTSSGLAPTTTIEYHAEVRGVVTGVDTTAQTFTVLGQLVRTDKLTNYVEGSFATLLNQSVEVSGFRSMPGDLLATLAIVAASNNPPPTPAPLVTGVVGALNPTAHTFAIGQQLCDYSGLLPAAVPAQLANGATVRVDGTQTSSAGTLFASSITVLTDSLPDAPEAEVEGLITAFNGLGSFQVSGQLTDGSSAMIEGGTADMLGNGVRVNVKGKLVAGVLIASSIEIEGVTEVEIDGTAQAVDPTAGTITVGGQVVTVTASTQFIDNSSAALRNFSLSALQVGDNMQILAFHSGNALVASKVVRLDPTAPPPGQPTTSIQGTISNFLSIASFVVAGQQVDAAGAAFVSGTSAGLANGRRLQVDGTLVNGILEASTVTFLPGSPPPTMITVTGMISNFVSVSSFTVAGQMVDASAASFKNGNASNLHNGVHVTVSGTVQNATLFAQMVSFATPPPTTLQVDGPISNFVSLSDFRVNGQAVNASQATIQNGTASDLGNGVTVSVRGPLQNGVLMATTVNIQQGSGQQQANVEGVITNFVSVGNFTVAGRVVDASAAKFDEGSAADLANGKSVDVQGTLVGAVLKAQEVEFQEGGDH